MSRGVRRTLIAWCELIRLPNLFTVVGDPLAGFLLAGGPLCCASSWSRAGAGVVVSLCAYICGLLWNDLADLDEDRATRSNRPLPSRRIRARAVRVVSACLLVVGLAVALLLGWLTFLIAIALFVCVALYDFLLKRFRLSGALVMGMCRGISMLVGASLISSAEQWGLMVAVPAMLLAIYVASVTLLAWRETETIALGVVRWLPVAALIPVWMFVGVNAGDGGRFSFLPLGLLSWVGVAAACRLGRRPEGALVARTVGVFIGGLLLLQATFCALVAGCDRLVAVGLVLLWPVAGAIGRRFYSS